MKFRGKQRAAAVLLLAMAAAASAQVPDPPPEVGVSCSGSVASLAFGVYDAFSPLPTDMQGSIVVQCRRFGGHRRMALTVGIGASGTSGSVQNRQLAQLGGPARLNYNLYREASRQSVWGDIRGVDTVDHFVELDNQAVNTVVIPLFGRIFPMQNPLPGAYRDTLLVTIEY